MAPLILEYIDLMSMAGITRAAGLDLGIPEDVKAAALAYLVVVLEQRTAERLDEDVEEVAEQLAEAGALDVYVLPSGAGAALIEAREKRVLDGEGRGRRRHHRHGRAACGDPRVPRSRRSRRAKRAVR